MQILTDKEKTSILEDGGIRNKEIVEVVIHALNSFCAEEFYGYKVDEEGSSQLIKERFSTTHTDLMKAHKLRFTAEGELDALTRSSKPGADKKASLKALQVAELQEEWRSAHEQFLDARRWEEFVRCLPNAMNEGTPESVAALADMVLLTAVWSPDISKIQEAKEKIVGLLKE